MKRVEDILQRHTNDVIRAFKSPMAVCYHTPNGGYRNIATAKALKAMGVMAGVPDWTILLPGGQTKFLELKTPKGTLSVQQKEFRANVETLGFEYAIARTPEQVRSILSQWDVIVVPS